MKNIKYLLVLIIAFSACKTQKVATKNTIEAIKSESARKIVKKHLASAFTANTLDSKIKVRYTNYREGKRKRHSFTVRLRMKKDSVIWMRGTAKVVTAFKMKITPNSFSFYSPVEKVFYEGDFSVIDRILGVKVSFSQLQDLLTGQSIFELKGKRFDSEIVDQSYKLTPKNQAEIFDVFFKINPQNYKLNQMLLVKEVKDQSLRVDYNAYTKLEENLYPIKVMINATEGEKYTYINMDYRSLTLNKPVNIPYKIPSGYKRIEL